MKRVLHFLSKHINKDIIESKISMIENAFISDDNFENIPDAPGIYIMVARTCNFIYPKKKSPVFYIGTSKLLKTRLKKHLRCYNEASSDFFLHSSWNYSRYNYDVAFGADIYYMRITGRECSKDLESKAMEGFYDKYGAIPVGNGAFSFKRSNT